MRIEQSPAVQLLRKFCAAYQKKDWELIESLFTKNTFSLCTKNGKILGKSKNYTKAKIVTLHEPIYTSGNWASCTWTSTTQASDSSDYNKENFQFTIVAKQEKDVWKISESALLRALPYEAVPPRSPLNSFSVYNDNESL